MPSEPIPLRVTIEGTVHDERTAQRLGALLTAGALPELVETEDRVLATVMRRLIRQGGKDVHVARTHPDADPDLPARFFLMIDPGFDVDLSEDEAALLHQLCGPQAGDNPGDEPPR